MTIIVTNLVGEGQRVDWTIFWTAAGVIVAAIVPSILWYADRRKKDAPTPFAIEGADWVLANDLTYTQFLQQLIGLDHEALRGLTDATAGNAETKAKVFEKSPDTWSLVVFNDTLVVGYWSCFSLSDNLTTKLLSGTMYDSEITEETICAMSAQKAHTLYFEMFGIRPSFKRHRRTILSMLLRSLQEFSEELARREVVIERICANGYSEDGIELCNKFGLELSVSSVQGGSIYCTQQITATVAKLAALTSRRRPSKM